MSAPDPVTIPNFVTVERGRELAQQLFDASPGPGVTMLAFQSSWFGGIKWARNSAHTIVDGWENYAYVRRIVRGAIGIAVTNRIDPDGLQDALRRAENTLRYATESISSLYNDRTPPTEFLKPDIWSDATLQFDAEQRGTLVRSLIEPALKAGYMSAGELKVGAAGRIFAESTGAFSYYPRTVCQCSMTVRNVKEGASGWTGVDDHDWRRIDPLVLNARAIEKCRRSANPVAVEPGRYTAILEPQAVADLLAPVFLDPLRGETYLDRHKAEQGGSPFSGESGYSKIGERVLDRRLTLGADPMDPIAGFVPFNYMGEAFRPVDWVKDGVLRDLAYGNSYALQWFAKAAALPDSRSFRLQGNGPAASLEDMIASTKRGVLVTRFSSVQVVDPLSLLLMGVTRDGLWLVENGQISKAIKNFRFTDSPFFALNSVEAIGAPMRVFRPDYPTVVPAVKVRDFNFTGLADAV